jgi:uncharacterized protein (DUF486 family)
MPVRDANPHEHAIFSMDQPLKLDDFRAGSCMVGAVYFIFRS